MNSGSLRKSSYVCRSARPDSICLLPQPYEMGADQKLKTQFKKEGKEREERHVVPRTDWGNSSY